MTLSKYKQYSLGYFNMARGLGTLMVILGHSMALFLAPSSEPVQISAFLGAGRVVGAGVMAMFFMISGFYFQPRPVGRCIKTQARLLLKPYYLTAALIILCRGLRQLVMGKSYRALGAKLIRTYLFGFNAPGGAVVFGKEVGTVSIFWFVLALFLGWVIYNFICRLKNKRVQLICVALCVVMGWALTEISRVWPLSIPMGMMAVGYIAIGAEIRERRLLEQNLPKPMGIAVGLIAMVSLAFGYVDMSVCEWKLGLLDVAGSFCVGYLILRLYSVFVSRNPYGLTVRLVENLGMHSIWIFCIHGFEKAMIPWELLSKLFPGRPVICMAVCIVGRLGVITVLFWLLYRLRKKIRRRRRSTIVLEDYREDSL